MGGHRRDIIWAYAVSFAKVMSWVVVYGALYRQVGAESAALLAMVRWTLGLLNYASAGFSPAILYFAARAQGREQSAESEIAYEYDAGPVLQYASRSNSASLRSVYISGVTLSWIGATIGLAGLWAWVFFAGQTRGVGALVGLFGTGMLIDLAADAWGAVIQSRGHIRIDYQCQVSLELIWALLAGAGILQREQLGISWQEIVGGSYCAAAILSAIPRAIVARRLIPDDDSPASERGNITRQMLMFGGLVVLSQIAEFLYAPTDFLLIRWLIDLKTVAVYAPAVQMDAGIWLLVSGLSTVLLPMSARRFGERDFAQLRQYYLRGTTISFLLLLAACTLAYIASPAIFNLWLGDKMPGTQRILPLVFISTVIGGSAAAGRAILLASGRVRAFTASVLLAGVANVILSYFFVVYVDMKLNGIILGTIIAVIARCAIWMPWYVMRSLNRLARDSHP